MASIALGLLSMGCGGPITGLPAIVLGAMARRDIERSGGLLEGRALAAGGIVSGLFGTGIGFVALLWVAGAILTPTTPGQAAASTPPPPLAPATAEPVLTTMLVPATVPGVQSFGSLEVVDLDDSRLLRTQLAEIVERAGGRTVVLQTFEKSSSACAAVADALPDLRMQKALENVTLVRVDVEEYERELGGMRIETKTAPWFYKLDAKGAPTDAIGTEAWAEANVPETMAPVLGKFVHPTSTGRRRPAR